LRFLQLCCGEFVSLLEVNQFFAHLVHLSFIFLKVPPQFRAIFLRTLGFLHAVLHVLHQHRQLPIFIVLELHCVF
jgi:hypothetical protein